MKEAGHEVTLVTGKGFEATVSGRGLCYVALDVDLLELAQSPEGRVALRSPRGALRMARGLMPTVRKILVDEWKAAASWGADALIYHPKAMGGHHIAEALGSQASSPFRSQRSRRRGPSRSRCCRCRIWEGPSTG